MIVKIIAERCLDTSSHQDLQTWTEHVENQALVIIKSPENWLVVIYIYTFLGAVAASVVEVVDFLDVDDCIDDALLLVESLQLSLIYIHRQHWRHDGWVWSGWSLWPHQSSLLHPNPRWAKSCNNYIEGWRGLCVPGRTAIAYLCNATVYKVHTTHADNGPLLAMIP